MLCVMAGASTAVETLEYWATLGTLAVNILDGLENVFIVPAKQDSTTSEVHARHDEAEGRAIDLVSRLFVQKKRKTEVVPGFWVEYVNHSEGGYDMILQSMGSLTLYMKAVRRRCDRGHEHSIPFLFRFLVERVHERQDLRDTADAMKFRSAVASLPSAVSRDFNWSREVEVWVQAAKQEVPASG